MASIVAVVTVNPDYVTGGVPIFIADDKTERERVAFSLEKIMNSTAHDLENGSFVLVDHQAESSS